MGYEVLRSSEWNSVDMNLITTTTGYCKLVYHVARLKHDLVLDVEFNSVEYRDVTVQHGQLYRETRQ